ncbi:sterol desaturase family protein [Undibacterium sp. Ji22W]|uniref:sterol desaturase family protein n=1 Tax=Undibacterium sp. Ji22W TaxID=3413038 RepID=UPI003BF16315
MKAFSTDMRAIRLAYWSEYSVLFYAALCLLLLGSAGSQLTWVPLVSLIAYGWLIYLAEEYFSHVTFFHGVMPQGKITYRFLYRLHHGHHDKPRRLDLLFTPMWYTFPALLLNAVCFALVTHDIARSLALTAGLILGYLMFEWWHLIVHSPVEPGPILRYVRNQHMGHHYWNEKRWYTISPPAVIFDVIFGTSGHVQQSPRSSNPTTAGLDQEDERLLAAREYYRSNSDWTEDESSIWKQTENEGLQER